MFGARASRELTRSTLWARCIASALTSGPAGSTGGASIEDGSSALNNAAGCRNTRSSCCRRWRRRNWSLVNGPRSGLRHYDPAHGWYWSSLGSLNGFRRSNWFSRWSRWSDGRSLRRSFRRNLGCGGSHFNRCRSHWPCRFCRNNRCRGRRNRFHVSGRGRGYGGSCCLDWSCGGWRWRGNYNRRLGRGRNRISLTRRRWGNRRLHHNRDCGRRRRHGRARSDGTSGSLGDYRVRRRARRDGRLGRRHNARFLAHRRHNLARLWPGGRRRCCCHHGWGRGLCHNRRLRRRGRTPRHLAPARSVFLFLLLRENCL